MRLHQRVERRFMQPANGKERAVMSEVLALKPSSRGILTAFREPMEVVVSEIEKLMERVVSLGSSGAAARQAGQEKEAESCFRGALLLAVDAASQAEALSAAGGRAVLLRTAIRLALDCGDVEESRRLMSLALADNPAFADTDEWADYEEMARWPDVWLVAAVRRDPPDEQALEALAERYWKPLFGRCQMLTLNPQKAGDLAQDAWCRVLRARHTLKPGGNFQAYLTTIAVNLWRDRNRASRRAGAMAEDRLESIDGALPGENGDAGVLGDVLPDLNTLGTERRTLLRMDIDQALARLSPLMREVLVARLLHGESAAEIGLRHGRTEQTISGWVRQASEEMRGHLTEMRSSPKRRHAL